MTKQSQAELHRLVEQAISEICETTSHNLWFCVDEVQAKGKPPHRLNVWATLHFLPGGPPFCCGEPRCHLWLFGVKLAQVGEHIQRAMGLKQKVTVNFKDQIGVNYHDGVNFQRPECRGGVVKKALHDHLQPATVKELTIRVNSEPDDSGKGFRAEAFGDVSFSDAFAEYGLSFNEAVGHLLHSLFDRGLLNDPVKISIH